MRDARCRSLLRAACVLRRASRGHLAQGAVSMRWRANRQALYAQRHADRCSCHQQSDYRKDRGYAISCLVSANGKAFIDPEPISESHVRVNQSPASRTALHPSASILRALGCARRHAPLDACRRIRAGDAARNASAAAEHATGDASSSRRPLYGTATPFCLRAGTALALQALLRSPLSAGTRHTR